MPFSQALVLWGLVSVVLVALGLWRRKALDASLIGLALVSSTILTGLAMLYPITQTASFMGIAVGWIRNFLVYTILLGLLTKTPVKEGAKTAFSSPASWF